MERAAYQLLDTGEHAWWYVARRWCVERALGATLLQEGKVLDFGAGRGASFDFLQAYGPVDAYEIDPESVAICMKRGYGKVYTEIPSAESRYALIGAFDVIEHIEDDVAALRQLHARIAGGGTLVITVPAYQWLWSAHDELHKHFRRYDKKSIGTALTEAGFTVRYATYWNMTLLPVAYLMRKVGKGGGEALAPSPLVNAILRALLWLESRCIPALSLPWGTGLVVVATK